MTYIPIFIWLAISSIMHQFNTLGAEFNMYTRYDIIVGVHVCQQLISMMVLLSLHVCIRIE